MERQSRSERFVHLALQFPGLRILWAVCTFGYRFPRVRKGENLTICIIRSFIIGFLRKRNKLFVVHIIVCSDTGSFTEPNAVNYLSLYSKASHALWARFGISTTGVLILDRE
ncbi:hypothetical protein BGX26_011400 [Mortierella sp. AD094]|nr:hypothetical protein BGX26_011400 [Mortierella sp. AD094]